MILAPHFEAVAWPTFAFFTHPEQSAIATLLSDADAELAALEARRDKTRAFEHGMMQERLTGRTRLISSDVVTSANRQTGARAIGKWTRAPGERGLSGSDQREDRPVTSGLKCHVAHHLP